MNVLSQVWWIADLMTEEFSQFINQILLLCNSFSLEIFQNLTDSCE